MEVNTGEFEPHLNHAPRKPLIINEFNILHRKIADNQQFTNHIEIKLTFTSLGVQRLLCSKWHFIIDFHFGKFGPRAFI